jgi:hypothetical protein
MAKTKWYEVTVPLFWRPQDELRSEEGGDPNPQQELRRLADDLHKRLYEAADIIEKLTANGWYVNMEMYEVTFLRSGFTTASKVRKYLEGLHIDPEIADIRECEDDVCEVEEGLPENPEAK